MFVMELPGDWPKYCMVPFRSSNRDGLHQANAAVMHLLRLDGILGYLLAFFLAIY
jgi:hypothetical protein